jgi:hypothetical protein
MLPGTVASVTGCATKTQAGFDLTTLVYQGKADSFFPSGVLILKQLLKQPACFRAAEPP